MAWNTYVPETVYLRIPELGEGALKVMLVLCRHADKDGTCFPSLERIAKHSGLSRRGVQKATQQLEKAGMVQVTRGGQDGKSSSHYSIAGVHARSPLGRTTVHPRGEQSDTLGVNGGSPKVIQLTNPTNSGLALGVAAPDGATTLLPGTSACFATSEERTAGTAIDIDDIFTLWRAAYQDQYGRDPIVSAKDRSYAKQLAQMVNQQTLSLDLLREVFTSYLTHEDPFLVNRGHNLSDLPSRLNGYLNQRASSDQYEKTMAHEIQKGNLAKLEAIIN